MRVGHFRRETRQRDWLQKKASATQTQCVCRAKRKEREASEQQEKDSLELYCKLALFCRQAALLRESLALGSVQFAFARRTSLEGREREREKTIPVAGEERERETAVCLLVVMGSSVATQ